MLWNVTEHLHHNSTIWSGHPLFDDVVVLLAPLNEKLLELSMLQGQRNIGGAEEKKIARLKLEEDTYSITKIALFLAAKTKDIELREKTYFTRSRLKAARENEITGMAEQVLKAATDNQVAMTPLGLTPAMLTGLADDIQKFNDKVSLPRSLRKESANATRDIPAVIKEAKELLDEQLDLYMYVFKESHSVFYNTYFSLRRVGKVPTHKRPLEISFVDADTDAALAKVSMKIKLENSTIRRKSSPRGNVRVQHIGEGAHKLTASLPSYKNTEVNFKTVKGETVKLKVEMEKSN
jgi:hypothetical protein